MITLTREEAQQVLDALEQLAGWDTATQGDIVFDPSDEIETLRARLAQPETEPVAWFTEDHREDKSATTYSKKMAERWKEKGWPVTPLYTALPQQEGCAECGKKSSDGWALYCVKCIETVQEPVGWIYEDDEGRMIFSQMPHPDPLWEPVYRAKRHD